MAKNSELPEYGAVIEQGEIKEVRETKEYPEYKVKSLNRPGVVSPWITSCLPIFPYHAIYEGDKHWLDEYVPRHVNQTVAEANHERYIDNMVLRLKYKVKDKVLFVLYDDGTGKILCKM